MPRTKVLHLITGLNMGGAERMLLKTLPHLSDNTQNRVCCFTVPGKLSAQLEKQGIKISYLGYRNLSNLPGVVIRFRNELDRYKPDILVTYLIHSDLFGRIFGRLFKVKRIYCSVRANLSKSEYFPLFLLDGLTSFLVDKYHFNSFSVARIYRRWFKLPENKITVIPNGIDFGMFKKLNYNRPSVRKSLGLTDSDLVIATTAKLRPQKGHLVLLESLRLLLPEFPHAKMLFIGDGIIRNQIEKRIKDLRLDSHVVMTGDRNDVPRLLPAFDVFVQASLYEGMSNSLLEAMAAKLAIVTTAIPENEELITHGESGLLCQLSPGDFAGNISKLLADSRLRNKLGSKAYERVSGEYNMKTVIKSWNSFLRI